MRCQFCEAFDYDQLTSKIGFKHHRNWQELSTSADRGCDICSLAREAARRGDAWDEQAWDEDERSQQIVCQLSRDTIFWRYGNIRRSAVFICTSYDDPLANIIEARPVFDSVFAPGCLEMMRGWIKRCEVEHQSCPGQEEHRLPTRVIDVRSASENPRLMVSRGRFGRWVALSHCWGQNPPLKTELANFKSHCEGIPMNEMTPTLRDAVFLTRDLGLRYLWIDSLCIVQDSEDDWLEEASTMDYIYQQAAFTIAAEASADGSIGIVGSMKENRRTQAMLPSASCYSNTRGLQGRLYFRLDGDKYSGWTSRGPLSSRAWAMQEEILSPRILRFAKHQVLWKCPADQYREWKPQGSYGSRLDFSRSLYENIKNFAATDPDYEMVPSPAMIKALLRFWYLDVINAYVARQITYPTDRLIALAGMVKEIQKYLSVGDYMAGIWREDIHFALSWSTVAANANTYDEYVAPTWSWAHLDFSSTTESQQGIYDTKLMNAFTPLAKILDITVQNVSIHSSKATTTTTTTASWALRVQGQYCNVCSCQVPTAFFDQRESSAKDYYYHLDRIANPVNGFIKSIGLEQLVTQDCSAPRSEEHKPYLYLQLGRWEPNPYKPNSNDEFDKPVIVALILQDVGTKLEAKYQRVGRALIPTNPLEHLVCGVKTVTIV